MSKSASGFILNPEDDAPELTDDWLSGARPHEGGRALAMRSSPRGESGKRSVNLRLSTEVLDYFRSTGEGWQARIDEVLRASIQPK